MTPLPDSRRPRRDPPPSATAWFSTSTVSNETPGGCAGRAGRGAAAIKLFAPDATTADAISRAPGGHAQATAGLRALREAGVLALEIRVPLHRDNLGGIERYAQLAGDVDVG